jgi:hypothetical protein
LSHNERVWMWIEIWGIFKDLSLLILFFFFGRSTSCLLIYKFSFVNIANIFVCRHSSDICLCQEEMRLSIVLFIFCSHDDGDQEYYYHLENCNKTQQKQHHQYRTSFILILFNIIIIIILLQLSTSLNANRFSIFKEKNKKDLKERRFNKLSRALHYEIHFSLEIGILNF